MFIQSQVPIFTLGNITAAVGVIIAAATFIFTFFKGLAEYRFQGLQKRTEHFIGLRKNLDEDEQLKKIIEALDDKVELLKNSKQISPSNKRYFLAFFEQIALMMNSKLISVEVANYMFGYYAIRCLDTKEFWEHMKQEKDDCHWSLFKDFAERMKEQDKILKRDIESEGLSTRRKYLRGKLRFH